MTASALPGEGKTFTSLQLALSMSSERGCNVILVDADIAKPRLSKALGLEGERGLVHYLTDDSIAFRDVLLGTNIPSLSVLPVGQAHANGPELLANRRMEKLTAELASLPPGNIVLFDSSPLLATNEAQVLSRLVGQVVMVVKADDTPRPAVQEALGLLSTSAAVGLVLNQNRTAFGARYYGDYYGQQRP
jgi:Mrp family chromosome partitioning ATPase